MASLHQRDLKIYKSWYSAHCTRAMKYAQEKKGSELRKLSNPALFSKMCLPYDRTSLQSCNPSLLLEGRQVFSCRGSKESLQCALFNVSSHSGKVHMFMGEFP